MTEKSPLQAEAVVSVSVRIHQASVGVAGTSAFRSTPSERHVRRMSVALDPLTPSPVITPVAHVHAINSEIEGGLR